jgi:hypothetical protein
MLRGRLLWVVGAVALALIAVVAVWAGVPGEKMLPLKELRAETGHCEWQGPEKDTIAGRVVDNVWHVMFDDAVVFDTGGGWDLFEAWLGVPDDYRDSSYLLTVYLDGQRVTTYQVRAGQPLSFFSVPLGDARSLKFALRGVNIGYTGTRGLAWVNPRLVRGRKTPAQPTDLMVGDGQLIYVELPGEYRVHFRR